MNERIKKLALQAKQSALDAMIKITDKEEALKVYSETYDTKFAKLIVKECADLCDRYQEIPATEPRHCANDIRSMFGVEEK